MRVCGEHSTRAARPARAPPSCTHAVATPTSCSSARSPLLLLRTSVPPCPQFQFFNSYTALFYIAFVKAHSVTLFNAFGCAPRPVPAPAPPAPARAARPSTDATIHPRADEDYNGDPYADACGTRGTEEYTKTGGDDGQHVLVRADCAFDLYVQMIFYIIAKPACTTSESRTRSLLVPRLLPADQEMMSSHLAADEIPLQIIIPKAMKKYNLYMKRRSLLMQAKGLGEAAFDTIADAADVAGDAAKDVAKAAGIEMAAADMSVEAQLKSCGAELEPLCRIRIMQAAARSTLSCVASLHHARMSLQVRRGARGPDGHSQVQGGLAGSPSSPAPVAPPAPAPGPAPAAAPVLSRSTSPSLRRAGHLRRVQHQGRAVRVRSMAESAPTAAASHRCTVTRLCRVAAS